MAIFFERLFVAAILVFGAVPPILFGFVGLNFADTTEIRIYAGICLVIGIILGATCLYYLNTDSKTIKKKVG
jgi:hypothetical protein